jgi:hypothetical protein
MGLVQSKWDNEECRFEDGIFFPDDTFILLTGSHSQGYQAAVRQPLQFLMEANPDGWTALDPVCSAEYSSMLIVGGGGSHEGDGFLAVVEAATRRLIWLLHLSGVEPFTEVRVDGSLLQAVSEEYPFRYEWTIPLESPHALHVIPGRIR